MGRHGLGGGGGGARGLGGFGFLLGGAGLRGVFAGCLRGVWGGVVKSRS